MDKINVLENLIAAEEIKSARYSKDENSISGLIGTDVLRELFGIEQAASVKDAFRAFHEGKNDDV